MAYILPDPILAHQVCSSCKNYLSFPPIKVYRNGDKKCGRCSEINDEGTISIIDPIARSMFFPCVNRFDGCSELLHYTRVKEHEKNCTILETYCWMCQKNVGSPLNLIHHYKTMHPTDVVATPEITLCLDKAFSRCVLYCDDQRNVLLILDILWNQSYFFVTYKSTAKTNKRKLKLALLVTANNDDTKQCKDLNYFLLDPCERQGFKVPDYCIKIKFKWSLDPNDLMTSLRGCLSKPTEEYKRSSYKFYLDNEFKEKYKILDTTKLKISDCGKKIVIENNFLQIVCDFCENMFAYSGYVGDVYSDGCCYVCGTCFIRGVKKCLRNNGNSFVKMENFDYNLLNFYCRFGCGKFFKSNDLLPHEDQCIFNVRRNICDIKFVQLQFGDASTEEEFSKKNVIWNMNRLKQKGKIYIATRDNFKCVIEYIVDAIRGLFNFHVNHWYDKKTYYISVHKWENDTYSEANNDFTMKIRNTNAPSLFALTVKEVQEDSTFVINI